jgi:hypothetical protein
MNRMTGMVRLLRGFAKVDCGRNLQLFADRRVQRVDSLSGGRTRDPADVGAPSSIGNHLHVRSGRVSGRVPDILRHRGFSRPKLSQQRAGWGPPTRVAVGNSAPPFRQPPASAGPPPPGCTLGIGRIHLHRKPRRFVQWPTFVASSNSRVPSVSRLRLDVSGVSTDLGDLPGVGQHSGDQHFQNAAIVGWAISPSALTETRICLTPTTASGIGRPAETSARPLPPRQRTNDCRQQQQRRRRLIGRCSTPQGLVFWATPGGVRRQRANGVSSMDPPSSDSNFANGYGATAGRRPPECSPGRPARACVSTPLTSPTTVRRSSDTAQASTSAAP